MYSLLLAANHYQKAGSFFRPIKASASSVGDSLGSVSLDCRFSHKKSNLIKETANPLDKVSSLTRDTRSLKSEIGAYVRLRRNVVAEATGTPEVERKGGQESHYKQPDAGSDAAF